MKKFGILFFLFAFTIFSCHAQSATIPDSIFSKFGALFSNEAKIFTRTEIEPAFPGGTQKWADYFSKKFDSAILTTANLPKGIYTVAVWTVIDTAGKRLLITPETNIGNGLESELIRILKTGPDWISAKQNNFRVAAFKRVSATIEIVAGQEDILTKYYDSTWVQVPKSAAFYFATFEKKDSFYLFRSYWVKSNKLQSKAVYADTIFKKAIGLLHKFYESGQTADSLIYNGDGQLSAHYHFFETGKLEFKKCYKDNFHLDSAFHFYQSGSPYIHYRYDDHNNKEVVEAFNENGSIIENFSYGNEAEFQGGSSAWRSFLENNLRANVPTKRRAPKGTYQVIVKFIVDTTGKLSDIIPETNLGYGMEDELVRVIKKSPKWIPAVYLNKKMNAYRRQPLTFIVEEK